MEIGNDKKSSPNEPGADYGQKQAKGILSQFEELFQNAPVAIYEIDFEGPRFKNVNEAMCRLSGFSREELLSTNPFSMLTPKSIGLFKERIGAALAGKRISENVEYQGIMKGGRIIDFVLNIKPIYQNGRFTGALVAGYDITERKKLEQELKESRRRFQDLIENTGDFIWETDSQGKYTYCSPQIEKIWGLKPDEMIGKTPFDVMPPKERKHMMKRFEESGNSPKPFAGLETTAYNEKGNLVYVETDAVPFFDDNGKLLGFRGVSRDVTKRRKAEESLRSVEKLLSSVTNAAVDAIYVKDSQSHWLFANPALERITGKPISELLGKTDAEIYPNPEIGNTILENDRKIMKSGKAETFEEFVDFPEGRHFFISLKSPRFDEQGNIIGVVGISHDITNRKRREEKLKLQSSIIQVSNRILQEALSARTEEKLGEVCLAVAQKITGSEFGFIGKINEKGLEDIAISNPGWKACNMYDQAGHRRPPGNFKIHGIYGRVLKEGKGLFTNDPKHHADSIALPTGHPPLESFLGVPLQSGKRTIGIIAVANRKNGFSQNELESLEALAPVVVEAFSRKKAEKALKKSRRLAHNRAEKLENLQIALEEKAAEVEEYATTMEQLANERALKLKDAERMAAIGLTAAMVGHDIRNPLQSILSELYLAKSELVNIERADVKHNLGESISSIENDLFYVNKIVQDLQDFAKPLRPAVKEFDLKEFFKEIMRKIPIPENVKPFSNVEEDARQMVSDPDLLKRAIENLVMNSIQAMPDGGNIIIRASKDKEETMITVEDTGAGIPEDARAKVFTPLFTTKSKGQGFGLAVVKRLIESLDGTVSFESQIGKGTMFIIRMPAKGIKPLMK